MLFFILHNFIDLWGVSFLTPFFAWKINLTFLMKKNYLICTFVLILMLPNLFFPAPWIHSIQVWSYLFTFSSLSVPPVNDQYQNFLWFVWNFYRWFLDFKKTNFFLQLLRRYWTFSIFLIFNNLDLFFINKFWFYLEDSLLCLELKSINIFMISVTV